MKRFFTKVVMLLVIVGVTLEADDAFSQASRINKGLYGGAADDLSFSDYNSYLFAAVQTPGSLFVSTDNGANWRQAFPNDSLEFAGGTRGWGGGGRQVLTNSIGWVALRTQQHGGTLNAAVISWNGGDSGTFKTLVDNYYLNTYIKPGVGQQNVNAIAISDYWVYVALGYYVTRFMDTTTLRAHTIRLRSDTVWNATGDKTISSIAISASKTGYPFYYTTNAGELFKFNGTVISKITLPGSTTAEYIYTHGKHWGGDTIFLSANMSGTRKVYRSFNGGSSWTDITPGYGTNWPLHDVDYSADFPAGIQSTSQGVVLAFPGGGMSYDLGNNWTDHVLPDNAMCVNPSDTSKVFGSYGTGVALSTNGREGTFTKTNNVGLSAIKISHIATNLYHGVYYVASNGGLGYTTAYFNNSVSAPDKWKSPNGDFPVSGVGDDQGVTTVAVDPYDSLHVIAGYSGGFEVTTTGPSGFSNVVPSGWDAGPNYDANVQAILFVTSSIVLAVTGTGSNALPCSTCTYGNIWRSTNGGSTWTKVTPSGFRQGTSLAKGPYSTSTIYAGQGYYDANYGTIQGNLWKSTDNGATWSYVNSGPESVYDTTTNLPIYDIAVDPRGKDTIWVAAGRNTSYALAKSTNGGASWTTLSVTGDGAFSSVLIRKSDPDIVHFSDRTNLYRYNNILSTNTKIYDGLPGDFIPDLEEGSVLMGTYTGLWALSETPGSIKSVWSGTGTWNTNANWSNGIPYNIVSAEIESGDLTISANAEAANVTIKAGTSLTLNNGYTLDADTLIIESTSSNTGAFVDKNASGGFSGFSIISRYLTGGTLGSQNGIIHYVSSPVSGIDVGDLIDVSKGNFNVYKYNSLTPGWERVFAGTTMDDGIGYAVAYNANKNLEFSGSSIHKGDYTILISNVNNRWNLIGNPYPSPVSLSDFLTNNTAIYGTAYFWDQSSGFNSADYASRNNVGGTNASANSRTPSADLAIAQAFFVESNGTGSSVSFNNSWRNINKPSFFTPDNEIIRFKLSVTNPDSAYNEILIGFLPEASQGFDNLYDAHKLNGNPDLSLSMFIEGDTNKYVIQGLPPVKKSQIVPLSLFAGKSGEYKFRTQLKELMDDYEVYFYDKVEDVKIDILENEYLVNLNEAEYSDRFSIIFNRKLTNEECNCASQNNLRMIKKGNTIYFYLSEKNSIENISVYDVSGKLILSKSTDNRLIQSLDLDDLHGVFIVSLRLANGFYNEKVILE